MLDKVESLMFYDSMEIGNLIALDLTVTRFSWQGEYEPTSWQENFLLEAFLRTHNMSSLILPSF